VPKYEFKCETCGVITEEDKPDGPSWYHVLEDRSVCGLFKRVYSFGGVILKGSGFYKTDNRGSGG
jgi:predicted nucleic acid-binding Zn ribbon protein